MRRIIVLVALPLCMAAARQAATPILSCQTITNRTTLTELQQRYGDFDNPERLDVIWADAQQTRMAALWTTARKSAWRSANGIKVGMAIADVDLLNERSFPLRGFGTEEAGKVLSWAGGKLQPATTDSCRLVVRFAPSVFEFTTLEWRLIEPIQSADVVASDEKRIKPYKPVVSAMGLEWR
jgi:hypothetical protein